MTVVTDVVTGMTPRRVLLVVHTGREAALTAARDLATQLSTRGVRCQTLPAESRALDCVAAPGVDGDIPVDGCDLVIAIGGDGTLLRAAELARPAGAPLLGINLGHVGFLTEAERSDLDSTAAAIEAARFQVEERLTLDVAVHKDGQVAAHEWALNDATVERVHRSRVLDVFVEVDDRPLSQWGCDGVVCATPTGSTAYAFSAGGPVVWPSVEALLLVPISAHALFARALVVAPDSCITIEIRSDFGAALVCDGRREVELGQDRIVVRRSPTPLRLVRLHSAPFVDRLVDKFQLPVAGWRGGVRYD